ncbi:ABC transporter permease [Blastopirellula retiformator]|uniref:Putative aliphatic sulfonates transport permease protein SsuC n=1 Tax=Blastopirellula retiformator TaxID=2527970 RepID=A0A5C5UTI5_9BACT|nr:ABC transporter permease subunit [Blastopirellula retiformator]TWT29734.1 putative aliphatic sulfonates transport permease protein SsuC [Blastopirellula retiformator]
MIRGPITNRSRILLGIASFFVLLVGYAFMSHRAHVENPRNKTIPNATQLQEGWYNIWAGENGIDLWADVKASAARLSLGVGSGVLAAFVIGLAMGCFPLVEAVLMPPISFFAKIPPTAMLAVYFVFFGVTGMQIFIALIAFGIFPTLAQAIAQAAQKDVDDHTLYKSYTLGATDFEVVWEVVIPQILPRIIENARLQIGPAMVFLVAAEFALADQGFGYTLRMQSRLQNMNIVYTYLALLGITGLTLDWLLIQLRRRTCPWFGD